MAQQKRKYLVRWRSLAFGEVDFWDEVNATSPEEACRIASQKEPEKFLEVYQQPEAEEL